MSLTLPKQLIQAPLEDIRAEDELFAITPGWEFSPALMDSVERVGLVQPLHLQALEGRKLRVVDGFQRLEAARRLGMSTVIAVVWARGDDEQLFLARVEEKAAARVLGEVEKGLVLVRLADHFGWPEQRLRQFLPRIGLAAEVRLLRRHLKLARAPLHLQEAASGLGIELALRLSPWNAGDQKFLLNWLRGFQVGRNKLKQLLRLLEEVRDLEAYRGMSLEDLWDRLQIEEAGQQPLAPAQRFSLLWSRLRQARYPVLSQLETQAQELQSALKIPPQIRLNLPSFFEGDRISFQLSARHSRELRELAERLRAIAEKPEMDQLFELL